LPEKYQGTLEFARNLISLRNRYPVLRQNRFLTGARNEALGIKDVTWLHPSGAEMNDETWRDAGLRSFGMLMDGRAQSRSASEPGSDATLLIIFNGHHEPVKMVLPTAIKGNGWRLEMDSSQLVETNHVFNSGETVGVSDRSLWLLSMF